MAVMFHGGAEAASAEPVWFEMGDVTISLRSDLSSLRKKKKTFALPGKCPFHGISMERWGHPVVSMAKGSRS